MSGAVDADNDVVVVLDAADARALTEEIVDGLDNLTDLIESALAGRAWAALGYASWADYCAAEITPRIRLSRDQRQDVVRSMHAAGRSTRAIGTAIGVSPGTVRNDLSAGGQSCPPDSPATVTGTDNKTYPAKTKARRAPLPERAQRAGWTLTKSVESIERLIDDDRFASNRGRLAQVLTAHLEAVADTCEQILDDLDPDREISPVEHAADAFGIPAARVRRAQRVKLADPALFDRIGAGELTVREAERLIAAAREVTP